MLLYIRDPNNSTRKLLEMISSAMWQDTESRKHLQQWCWGNLLSTCKGKKPDLYLSPFTKSNSKWTKDLKVKPENLKLLEKNTGGAYMIQV